MRLRLTSPRAQTNSDFRRLCIYHKFADFVRKQGGHAPEMGTMTRLANKRFKGNMTVIRYTGLINCIVARNRLLALKNGEGRPINFAV